jgi:hypothetical protein
MNGNETSARDFPFGIVRTPVEMIRLERLKQTIEQLELTPEFLACVADATLDLLDLLATGGLRESSAFTPAIYGAYESFATSLAMVDVSEESEAAAKQTWIEHRDAVIEESKRAADIEGVIEEVLGEVRSLSVAA